MKGGLKKSFFDYAIVISGTSLSRGFSFLSSILIARWLGTDAFGIYSLFFITNILTWQFSQAFDITFIRKVKDVEVSKKRYYLNAAIVLKILYGIVVIIFAFFGSGYISSVFFTKPEVDEAIFYGIFSGAFVSILRTHGALWQEKEKYGLYSLNYLLFTGSIFLGLIVARFIFPDMTIISVIKYFTIISIAVGISSLYMIFRHDVGFKNFDLEIIFESIKFGKWVLGITLLSSLFVRLDVLFIARFADFHHLGLYSSSAQFIMILSLLTGAMSGVFLPKSIKAVSAYRNFSNYIKELFMPLIAILALIISLYVFAPLGIELTFGKEYNNAVPILRILLIGWIFQVLYLPFQYLFYSLDKTTVRFILELIKVLTLIALLMLLVPKYGTIGSAWSISIVYAMNMILSSILLYKYLSKKFSKL